MPQRIQQRRTKGWRKPEGAIVVGRPTVWGNPFKAGESTPAGNWHQDDPRHAPDKDHTITDTGEAVALYREAMRRGGWYLAHSYGRPDGELLWVGMSTEFWQIRGHDLACWCPLDQPCHADVLLELANPPSEEA